MLALGLRLVGVEELVGIHDVDVGVHPVDPVRLRERDRDRRDVDLAGEVDDLDGRKSLERISDP